MNDPNWAQIATAVIAFAAFWGAVAQLERSRRADRRAAAYRYFERWNAAAAIDYQVKLAVALVDVPPAEAQRRWGEWANKPYKYRLEAMLFMNFFEELGGLYNSRLVDRKVIRKFLGVAVVAYWERTSWWIDRARVGSPRLFDQWKLMYEDVKEWRERTSVPSRWQRIRRRMQSRRTLRRRLAEEQRRSERVEAELNAAIAELRAKVS